MVHFAIEKYFSILVLRNLIYSLTYIEYNLDNELYSTYISDPWSKDYRPLILSSDDGPIFDNSLVTNVTAQFGGTAHLPCKVHNIKYADNPVSNVVRSDLTKYINKFKCGYR